MAEANEATAAQIAAHNPSDNSNATRSEARMVRREKASAADPSVGPSSSGGLRRSVG
jgi:hypothetical protein